MCEHSQLLHFPFQFRYSFFIIFFFFNWLTWTVILHRRQVLFLDFEASFFPLLVNNVGDRGHGFIPHVFFSLHVGVMDHDLVEQTLLVESLDSLHDLTLSMVTLLHQVSKKQAH